MKIVVFLLFIGVVSAASFYEKEKKTCTEEMEMGPCQALFRMWYYDTKTQSCKKFIYGGCQGNGNRYWTEKECLENCKGDGTHEEAMSEFNLQDILRKIKEHIKKTVDPELLREKIEKLLGQGSELLDQLLKTLKERGRNKLMILIDALLDEEDEDVTLTHGLGDYWEKIKDYFKELKIDLLEKYARFGEWVKDRFGKGFENSKDRIENIKAIAKEFVKHAKGISKEVAAEAGEFFKSYKEELGIVWDEIKEKIKEIKNRED